MGMKLKLGTLKLNTAVIENILEKKSEKISYSFIDDLAQTAPIDDTTKEVQRNIFKATGKRAWLMDNKMPSREMWRLERITKSSFGGGVRSVITNKNPASIALALGFTGLIKKGYEPVERTKNGKYSEQDPRGRYILESLRRAFQKNGIKNIKINK